MTFQVDLTRTHRDFLAEILVSHLQMIKRVLAEEGIKPSEDTAATILLEAAVGFCVAEIGYGPTSARLKEFAVEAVADRIPGYAF